MIRTYLKTQIALLLFIALLFSGCIKEKTPQALETFNPTEYLEEPYASGYPAATFPYGWVTNFQTLTDENNSPVKAYFTITNYSYGDGYRHLDLKTSSGSSNDIEYAYENGFAKKFNKGDKIDANNTWASNNIKIIAATFSDTSDHSITSGNFPAYCEGWVNRIGNQYGTPQNLTNGYIGFRYHWGNTFSGERSGYIYGYINVNISQTSYIENNINGYQMYAIKATFPKVRCNKVDAQPITAGE